MKIMTDNEEDTLTYPAVVNREEQYSTERSPRGEAAVGGEGSRTECLGHICELGSYAAAWLAQE